MRKVLLDTNAYSQLLRGDKKILEMLSQSDLLYMSIFVLGELYAGFKGGSREKENKHVLNRFLEKKEIEILSASHETSQIFGELKHTLKHAGTPIPINDVWIAAHALETGSILITYDQHFTKVSGLRIWDEL